MKKDSDASDTPQPQFFPSNEHPLLRAKRFFFEIFSGSTFPLTNAFRQLGLATLYPMDSHPNIGGDSHDIINSDVRDRIARLAVSQLIGLCFAAPPCRHYSLCKLTGPGPPPCRDFQNMQGFDTMRAKLEAQESFNILATTLELLELFWIHGSHIALEQPETAMSWSEPIVIAWIQRLGLYLTRVAQCAWVEPNEQLRKSWMIASSFPLPDLETQCSHQHPTFKGKRDSTGQFVSQQTSCYPPRMAQQIAKSSSHLVTHSNEVSTWDDALSSLPRLSPMPNEGGSLPCADGGGISSNGDWTSPRESDILADLRRAWLLQGLEQKVLKQTDPCSSIDFEHWLSGDFVKTLRSITDNFFRSHQLESNEITSEGQPFVLHLLQNFAILLNDPEQELINCLQEGVMCGVEAPIPPGGAWIPTETTPTDLELSSHDINWQSAVDHMSLAEELVKKEVEDGFVECLGPVDQLSKQSKDELFFGKLGIAFSTRKPRLVLDSTISGVNPKVQIQERIFNPTMLDVRNSFPATPESQQHVALVMDVSAAHKRIKLHPSQKGYSAFSLNGLAYQYRTCHFGATYSAYYWGRLAGFLHRVAHRLLFNSHRGFIYVDDWLWIFRKEWAVIQAFLVTCLWNVLGLPMSWHKTTMSSTVTWLGWQINLEEMTISVTQEKFDKMFSLLPAKIPDRMRRKDLESVVGIHMWISQVIPHLKSNLATLYHDCAQGSVSAKFVQPKLLQSIIESCSSNLHMLSNVGSIKSGCKLLKISRHPVSSQEQARALARQFQGGWIVLYDIRSRNVNLSQASIHFLQTTRQMLQGNSIRTSLRPPLCLPLQMAADACASGNHIGLGAWFEFENTIIWAKLEFNLQEFPYQEWVADVDDASKVIACWETLAQVMLVRILRLHFRNCRIPCCIRSLVDNAAVLGSANKLFTTSQPLNRFIHILVKELHLANLKMDLEWIATDENKLADDISRNVMDWCSNIPNRECQVLLSDLMSDSPQARRVREEGN